MLLKGLFGDTLPSLERSLDLRSRNHQLISSNIANLDTPDYKAFKMEIEEALATGKGGDFPLQRTHARHLAPRGGSGEGVRVETVDSDPTLMRGDGNTVSLDREMANLAENTLMYNAGIRMTSKQFQLLMNAIKGGK